MSIVRIAAGAVLFLLACSIDPPSITLFPVPADVSAGSVMVDVSVNQGEPLRAVVDTLSPLTVLDSVRPGGVEPGQPVPAPRRHSMDLAIVAAPAADRAAVPRARFDGASVFELHPCVDASRVAGEPCRVGLEGMAQPFHFVLGADALARYAVRFWFGAEPHLLFLPDVAGTDEDRASLCDAVFPTPFYGGGTMVIGGAELELNGRRIAVGACWMNTSAEIAQSSITGVEGIEQGLDGLFLVSTGLSTTIVTESVYAQYRDQLAPDAPALAELAQSTLHLPSGPVPVRLAVMRDLALVGASGNDRGPCYERYANAFMRRELACADPADPACPCSDDARFCRAAAVVELGGDLDVAVVSDDSPIIGALRTELRPSLPQISGILGASTLRRLELDVDYPNNRVVARCADPSRSVCVVRPAALNSEVICSSCAACQHPVVWDCQNAGTAPACE